MHTIGLNFAIRQFHGKITVGEYVAYWVSDDRQHGMPMTDGSHKTAEAAEADAAAEGARERIEGGAYVASLVVEAE